MEKIILSGAFLIFSALIGWAAWDTHERDMIKGGFKKVPVCVMYEVIWVGGGPVDNAVRSASYGGGK